MSFFIGHRWGGDEGDPPLDAIPALLAELDDHPEDLEHGSVFVQHESAWAITVTVNGYVHFEYVEADRDAGPFHLPGGRDSVDVVTLLEALALGRLDEVRSAPWAPGYGS